MLTTETITCRLDRLERENRRLRLVGSAALAMLCLIFFVGAKWSKIAGEVRARTFTLVDKDGKDRAVMAMGADGMPTLALYDQDGTRHLALGVTLKSYKRKPGLWIADQDGEVFWQGPR